MQSPLSTKKMEIGSTDMNTMLLGWIGQIFPRGIILDKINIPKLESFTLGGQERLFFVIQERMCRVINLTYCCTQGVSKYLCPKPNFRPIFHERKQHKSETYLLQMLQNESKQHSEPGDLHLDPLIIVTINLPIWNGDITLGTLGRDGINTSPGVWLEDTEYSMT